MQAFWRAQGYSGEVVTNGGLTANPNCSSGPVCIVYDACLHNGAAALLAFIAGDVKIEWSQQSVSLFYFFESKVVISKSKISVSFRNFLTTVGLELLANKYMYHKQIMSLGL